MSVKVTGLSREGHYWTQASYSTATLAITLTADASAGTLTSIKIAAGYGSKTNWGGVVYGGPSGGPYHQVYYGSTPVECKLEDGISYYETRLASGACGQTLLGTTTVPGDFEDPLDKGFFVVFNPNYTFSPNESKTYYFNTTMSQQTSEGYAILVYHFSSAAVITNHPDLYSLSATASYISDATSITATTSSDDKGAYVKFEASYNNSTWSSLGSPVASNSSTGVATKSYTFPKTLGGVNFPSNRKIYLRAKACDSDGSDESDNWKTSDVTLSAPTLSLTAPSSTYKYNALTLTLSVKKGSSNYTGKDVELEYKVGSGSWTDWTGHGYGTQSPNTTATTNSDATDPTTVNGPTSYRLNYQYGNYTDTTSVTPALKLKTPSISATAQVLYKGSIVVTKTASPSTDTSQTLTAWYSVQTSAKTASSLTYSNTVPSSFTGAQSGGYIYYRVQASQTGYTSSDYNYYSQTRIKLNTPSVSLSSSPVTYGSDITVSKSDNSSTPGSVTLNASFSTASDTTAPSSGWSDVPSTNKITSAQSKGYVHVRCYASKTNSGFIDSSYDYSYVRIKLGKPSISATSQVLYGDGITVTKSHASNYPSTETLTAWYSVQTSAQTASSLTYSTEVPTSNKVSGSQSGGYIYYCIVAKDTSNGFVDSDPSYYSQTRIKLRSPSLSISPSSTVMYGGTVTVTISTNSTSPSGITNSKSYAIGTTTSSPSSGWSDAGSSVTANQTTGGYIHFRGVSSNTSSGYVNSDYVYTYVRTKLNKPSISATPNPVMYGSSITITSTDASTSPGSVTLSRGYSFQTSSQTASGLTYTNLSQTTLTANQDAGYIYLRLIASKTGGYQDSDAAYLSTPVRVKLNTPSISGSPNPIVYGNNLTVSVTNESPTPSGVSRPTGYAYSLTSATASSLTYTTFTGTTLSTSSATGSYLYLRVRAEKSSSGFSPSDYAFSSEIRVKPAAPDVLYPNPDKTSTVIYNDSSYAVFKTKVNPFGDSYQDFSVRIYSSSSGTTATDYYRSSSSSMFILYKGSSTTTTLSDNCYVIFKMPSDTSTTAKRISCWCKSAGQWTPESSVVNYSHAHPIYMTVGRKLLNSDRNNINTYVQNSFNGYEKLLADRSVTVAKTTSSGSVGDFVMENHYVGTGSQNPHGGPSITDANAVIINIMKLYKMMYTLSGNARGKTYDSLSSDINRTMDKFFKTYAATNSSTSYSSLTTAGSYFNQILYILKELI